MFKVSGTSAVDVDGETSEEDTDDESITEVVPEAVPELTPEDSPLVEAIAEFSVVELFDMNGHQLLRDAYFEDKEYTHWISVGSDPL